MGIEEGRCRLLLRRRRRPSISIYAFHILSARHCLLPPLPFPRKPILYLRQENKHVATAAKAGTQSPFAPLPPSRLSTSERRVNKFYMVEESRDIHAYRLSFSLHLFLSSSFLPFSPQSLNMYRHTASKQMDIAKWFSQQVSSLITIWENVIRKFW